MPAKARFLNDRSPYRCLREPVPEEENWVVSCKLQNRNSSHVRVGRSSRLRLLEARSPTARVAGISRKRVWSQGLWEVHGSPLSSSTGSARATISGMKVLLHEVFVSKLGWPYLALAPSCPYVKPRRNSTRLRDRFWLIDCLPHQSLAWYDLPFLDNPSRLDWL